MDTSVCFDLVLQEKCTRFLLDKSKGTVSALKDFMLFLTLKRKEVEEEMEVG